MTLEEGRSRLLAAIRPLDFETVTLAQADGRILASGISAPMDLPPFDNSAMDGYALRAADSRSGNELRVVGTAVAGQGFCGEVGEMECVRVFTGSPLPAGTDAVVMQEDAIRRSDGETILLSEPSRPWENIRLRGEDVRAGQLVLGEGVRMTPASVGLFAALGIDDVPVRRRPRVALLPNGSELAPAGGHRRSDQVFESNGPMLAALLARNGFEVALHSAPPDKLGSVTSALRDAALSADAIVSIGGASVGDHDLVRPAFTDLGGSVEFWKLAIKPGKPFFFGHLGAKSLFGLPGNPVSAFVTCVLLVLPALRKLAGEAAVLPPADHRVVSEPISNPDRRRHFIRVRSLPDGSVVSSGPQASHHLRGLALADGLVDVEPGATIRAGQSVPVIRW